MNKDRVEKLREKCKISFEERKKDSEKRLKFLQDANILDKSGNYNAKVFNTETN